MDLSGIIFVVLALVWAGYLIPKALQHHDEVARTRSIERFSTAMRVLAHREPVNRRDARLVVTPARAHDNPRIVLPTTPAVPPAAVTNRAVSRRPTSGRAAARAAARRRRRIIAFLLLCDVLVGALTYLIVLPGWSLAIPALLTLLYLVLCRTQARRERRVARAASHANEEIVAPPRRAVRVEMAHGTPAEVLTAGDVQPLEEVPATDDPVTVPAVTVDAVAENGGSLWDPLPVTLPTYVTKPKATRTVRTIDLTEPGAWTSGHTEADSRLVQDASVEGSEAAPDAGQRAVGS